MGVRLTVKMKGEAGEGVKTVMLDDDVIILGRDETCQVVLAQQAVSRNHARISRDGPLFFVEDLGSSYGTQINGKRLPKGEKRLLRNGDTIAIAQFDVVFDRMAAGSEKEVANTLYVSRKVVKDVMKGMTSGGEQPFFRVMNGPKEGQRIEISDAKEYVFGRDDSADVVLNSDLVSRRHAKVRRDWAGTHVEDLESRNGIKVNRKRTKRQTLKDRDEVEIGGVRLLYIDPTEVRETPVVLPEPENEEEATAALAEDPRLAAPEAETRAESMPQELLEEHSAVEESPSDDSSEQSHAGEVQDEAEAQENNSDSESASQESEEPEEPEGPRKLIDFSNRPMVIALGIGGAMVVLGVVLFIMLFAAWTP